MKNKILTALISPYPLESSCTDFSEAYAIAGDWVKGGASTEALLWQATMALLCGKLYEAEAIGNKALKNTSLGSIENAIGGLLLECVLYDRYERMPGENSTPFADLEAAKASNGYYWALQSMLPEEDDSTYAELIQLLNQQRKVRDWRVSRNLLAGSMGFVLTNEWQYCSQEASKGHIIPVLALAGFYKWYNKPSEMAQPLEIARSIAEKDQSPITKAEYLLFEGDRLAAPRGFPVLWNFFMQTPHFNSTSDVLQQFEDRESQLPTAADVEQALKYYASAGQYFQQVGSNKGLGHIALRYGYLAFWEEEYATALQYSGAAADCFSKAGDTCFFHLAKTYTAILLTLSKRFGEAVAQMHEIADWGLANGQCSWTAGLGHLVNRAARHFSIRKSDTENSLRLYRLARDFHNTIGHSFAAAQNNIDLAKLYERIGHTLQASNLYLEGLEEMNAFFEKTEKLNLDAFVRSLALLEMCTLCYKHVNLGIQKANHILIEKGLDTAIKATAHLQTAGKFDPLAQSFASGELNDYKALEGNAQVLSAIYRAKAERENGNESASKENILKAERILKDVDLPPDMSKLLEVKIAVARDDWDKARAYGLEYANLVLAKSLPTAFGVDFNTAAGQFLQQTQNYQSINQIFSLLIRLRLYKEALPWYEKLCAQFGAQWWVREAYPWFEISNIAEMWEGLGDNNRAQVQYEAAINLFEQYRSELTRDDLKRAIADMQNMVYTVGYAARCAFKVNEPEKAFRYTESAKARSLFDLMQENRIFGDAEQGFSALLYQLREKSAQRSSLQNEIHGIGISNQNIHSLPELRAGLTAVEAEIAGLEERIAIEYPEHLGRKNAIMQPTDIQAVAETLEKNTLLISYFYSGDELFIWAISNLGLLESRMMEIKDWQVKSSVELLRKAIVGRNKNWKSLADKLSRLLLYPVAVQIKAHEKLIFVLHDALQGLPMHVLEVGDGGRPIGFSHAISYLPGVGALGLLRNTRISTAGKVLAIGNPTGDLRAATAEVRQIGRLFPDNAQVFVSEEAREDRVKEQMASARILHFATHGNFSEDNPMASSLSLANGEEITVQELMGINLNAELVVLSACNSGRGQQTAGDDLIGLSRALLACGANAAVLTYWQVDDIATGLWMKQFYTELKKGCAAAEAARAAQTYLYGLTNELLEEELSGMWEAIDPVNPHPKKGTAFRASRGIGFTTVESSQDYRHPYYWAAFSVMGR